jgi:hypothetical protein
MIKPLIITGGPEHWALPEFLEQISDWIQAPHLVTPTTVGSLEMSSTIGDGHTAFFGKGNSTDHYLHLFDHTSNIEFGLEDHYRTGDYVNIVKDAHGDFSATMDAGHQTQGLHNEQYTAPTRSAASVDISLNFGNEKPTDGKFVLDVNGHDFTLGHEGNNWFMADSHGASFGLTMSPDGHVLQDSVNFGFHAFSYLAHTSENSGDLAAQDVHVSLTEMVGTVGVAQVSETIHLTGHPVEIT